MHRLALTMWIPAAVAVAGVAAAAAGAGATSRPSQEAGIEAVSRPSEDRTLSFIRPGFVAKVHVKEGDSVRAGQMLIELDDAAEQSQLAQFKAEAEDEIRILAAQADLDQKNVDLKKIEQAAQAGGATELEVEHARLEVLIKKWTHQLAIFQKKQAELKYAEAQAQVARMRMTSPIDGRVEIIAVQEGEAAKDLEKVIRIIRIDPLWVEVPVPLAEARTRLREGQVARVTFVDGPDSKRTANGKIVRIRGEADAGSDTLNVRVEVPNPDPRPAGEHVFVSFPPVGSQDGGDHHKGNQPEKSETQE